LISISQVSFALAISIPEIERGMGFAAYLHQVFSPFSHSQTPKRQQPLSKVVPIPETPACGLTSL